jgi:hypothetical protein
VNGLTEFLGIAWPGLLALAGFVALIAHAAHAHRRRHPRGRWRIRFEGPRGVLTAEHEMTEKEAAQVAEVARRLLGEPLRQPAGEATAPTPNEVVAYSAGPVAQRVRAEVEWERMIGRGQV